MDSRLNESVEESSIKVERSMPNRALIGSAAMSRQQRSQSVLTGTNDVKMSAEDRAALVEEWRRPDDRRRADLVTHEQGGLCA